MRIETCVLDVWVGLTLMTRADNPSCASRSKAVRCVWRASASAPSPSNDISTTRLAVPVGANPGDTESGVAVVQERVRRRRGIRERRIGYFDNVSVGYGCVPSSSAAQTMKDLKIGGASKDVLPKA